MREVKCPVRMSESRKTLFRYSDEIKVTSRTPNNPYCTPEQEGRAEICAQVTSQGDNGVSAQECDMSEATKRLNIPFDEVVYQDLISLNDIRRKIKCDELIGFDGKQRKLKKCDPEPDLFSFFQPTKQEFLFCDLLGKDLDVKELDSENCHSSLAPLESDEKLSKDYAGEADGESEKFSACEEMDFENPDMNVRSTEKIRLLHENYGLEPAHLKAYFAGFSLCERSLSWKISGKSHTILKNS